MLCHVVAGLGYVLRPSQSCTLRKCDPRNAATSEGQDGAALKNITLRRLCRHRRDGRRCASLVSLLRSRDSRIVVVRRSGEGHVAGGGGLLLLALLLMSWLMRALLRRSRVGVVVAVFVVVI